MDDFVPKVESLLANISQAVVARRETLELVIAAFLCNGHVLLKDVPGVGKTLLAKTLAQSLDATFRRIQFTPDLLPSDITGSSIYNQKSGEFTFVPGPIFTNILLADEINRATPRTQSALLEAMGERQATMEGVTYKLPQPFFVIATENPVETYGVFQLPEAELDRFLLSLSLGYPPFHEEVTILDREEHEPPSVSPILGKAAILRMQEEIRQVQVSTTVKEYIVSIAREARAHPEVLLGVSPRGTVALQRAAQAVAAMAGRHFVIPDDVKRVARPVMAHRLMLKSSVDGAAAELVDSFLAKVPVPL